MRVQLKQNEIEKAIKNFLEYQGITIVGKSISMLFTSGRKDNGMVVDVDIEDVVITPENYPEQVNTKKVTLRALADEESVPIPTNSLFE